MADAFYSSRRGEVAQRRADKVNRKVERREHRLAAKAERTARGARGAPVDYSASQFPNAFPAIDGDPIHEGLARTLSRGLP